MSDEEKTTSEDVHKFEEKYAQSMGKAFNTQNSFLGVLGVRFTNREAGQAIVELTIAPHHLQPNGVVHGGVLFSLADTAAGTALHSLTGFDYFIATVEAKMNYIAPAPDGELVAEASVSHKGGTLAVTEVKVFNRREGATKLVAMMLATFIMRPLSGKAS